jgi:uncharacterized protein
MTAGTRRAAIVVLAGLGLVTAAAIGVGFHYSNAIVGPDRPPTLHEQRVLAVGQGRIRLTRDRESLQPGTWALQWQDGYGWVGPVLAADSTGVVRTFRAVTGGLRAGAWASLRGVSRSADPMSMLGRSFETVSFDGPLGSYPAWLVPGDDSTWVIYVHGRGANRAEGLRGLSVLAARGLPGLLVTYRNDPGAPRSPDGLNHLGLTEWADLDAAARFALAHGARDLVLCGYSMGGQIVAQFLANSPRAARVRGVVLESPLLDWDATVAFRARVLGVPAFATWLGKRAATFRAAIAWDRLDFVRRSPGGTAPILVFHSVRDDVTPASASEAFARELGARVTLVRLRSGNHVEAWNADPEAYARAVNGWCSAHHIGREPR